ncbi:UDP-N-acetylmuramate--L-alanine ligase [Thermomicrobium sp. 4228-Ro]|uniref:UDP-N-acetylmuramate--L-alanine ligase n=1 Tax=Thermomicrobium sp. 4228-Ro TaxID=2993937 RepID=UPI0022488E9A|nr:UDP-N-acetylmuramate--L-alanine ligase [Thermomicrobium sp. 4228-Ro]MCX2727294.1 UDP-N-acetylmuramate--L-alanine ligase [Thermomicrobium sp. 4228-Ro]
MSRVRLPAQLETVRSLHFLGIGGAGMSGLAELAVAAGFQVSGCDAAETPLLERLRERGIAVYSGHDPQHVQQADLLVVTSAVRADHPEVAAFASRRRPIVKRAALLGWLASGYRTIAVAGTHGKSTTSAMIALVLEEAARSPSFAIGAEVLDLGGSNARLGSGEDFVVEADEYDYSFLLLEPEVAVVLNVDHDHPDLFPDHASVVRAFRSFLARVRPQGTVVLSADDAVTSGFVRALRASAQRVVTFGSDRQADFRVLPDGTLRDPEGTCWRLTLAVPGWHNRLNAAAAVAAVGALGVPVPLALEALARFHGVGRRFQEVGMTSGARLIVDYAHHPREVAATLQAARERFPTARVWAVFQPHTYTRTLRFLDEFARALENADLVVVTDVYAARERPLPGVDAEALARRIGRVPAIAVPDPSAAAQAVAAGIQAGDVVLFLGAGDIWKAAQALREDSRDAGTR